MGQCRFSALTSMATVRVRSVQISTYTHNSFHVGDADIVSASTLDSTVAWHENLDGIGESWSTHIISSSATNVQSVFAIDLEEDGAPPARRSRHAPMGARSIPPNRPLYLPPVVIARRIALEKLRTNSALLLSDCAFSILCAQRLPLAGDIDVVSASSGDYTIAWYANDGSGASWSKTVIATAVQGLKWVFCIDLDGDGQ